MIRTADVQTRESASRMLPGGLLPGCQFPHESVDDSRYARHRIVRSRCARPAVRHREDRERQRAARHRGVVMGFLRTH